jgi:hypothetical protein
MTRMRDLKDKREEGHHGQFGLLDFGPFLPVSYTRGCIAPVSTLVENTSF